MNRIMKKLLILALGVLFVAGTSETMALPKFLPNNDKKDKKEEIQRPSRGVFDLQQNTVSNLSFYQTNYGIFGYNVQQGDGGGFWPRGSLNQYIFAGGVWFGCIKPHPQMPGEMKKYVSVTYNPNSGKSWMVPGRIEDGDFVEQNDINKYRVYFSTDFIASTGAPLSSDEGQNWPIWDTDKDRVLMYDRYFGRYVMEPSQRNTDNHKKGPAFISGEDIFTTFKDTDLSRYEGGVKKRRDEGYPLRLQYEQTIYSWGYGDYKDFIFLRYDIINYSNDTLWECWMSPVMDVDLGRVPNTAFAAGNDRVRYYFEEESLNLAIQWTNTDRGEKGYGFGYLGFDFLESPAVIKVLDDHGNEIITDSTSFVRRDKAFYTNDEQLGLVTFRNWSIDIDAQEDEPRYNLIAGRVKDGDTGPGDKRFCMATGPFNMRPRDTVRVVVGMILASVAVRNEADGTTEDVQELVRKDRFAQYVYDNNFRAPRPPERSKLFWKALNNAVMVTWDSTAEMSNDGLEEGLSFMGYRLYRARRTDLDTFSLDVVQTTPTHIKGTGPYGWKEVGHWTMPTPFKKSHYSSNKKNPNDPAYPKIDSLVILGPYVDPKTNMIDTFAMQVMRIPKGIIMWPDDVIKSLGYAFPDKYFNKKVVPVIGDLDTGIIDSPWNKYFVGMVNPDDFHNQEMDEIIARINKEQNLSIKNTFLFYGKDNKRYKIFDSVMVGVARYASSLVPYNPLFFNKTSIKSPYAKHYLDTIPDNGVIFRLDTVLADSLDPITKDTVFDKDGNPIKVDVVIKLTIVDTVYVKGTSRSVRINGRDEHWVDVLLPINIDTCMNDLDRVRNANDFLYKQIQNGNVTLKFPVKIETLDTVRENIIEPYMKQITNDRTFVDIGDDNGDNYLATGDQNITKNEKLINNVDYYYKMIAYDEGDFIQPTPLKVNDAAEKLPNLIKAIPGAAEVGKPSTFEITYIDSSRIGGLYNFQFWPIDQDRVNQNFAGHELELTFNPIWNLNDILLTGKPESARIYFGLYRSSLTIVDLTTQEMLYNGRTQYEVTPCQWAYREAFTENAASYVLSDTTIIDTVTNKEITFGLKNNKEIITRSGKFSTGDMRLPAFCYTSPMMPKALGTFGFSFDFTMQQYGGLYRADTIYFASETQSGATLGFRSDNKMVATSVVDTAILGIVDFSRYYPSYVYGSYNCGPGHYLVEFLPGGREDVKLYWGYENKGIGGEEDIHRDSSNTFSLDYLTIRVHNLLSFNRPDPSGDSVKVHYPNELTYMEIPYDVTQSNDGSTGKDWELPDLRNLKENSNDFIGRFNISAYGWVNFRHTKPTSTLKQVAAGADSALITSVKGFSGLQGKYYLTGTSIDGKDIVDFTHIVNIGGISFALDKANKGKINTLAPEWDINKDDFDINKPDFKAGDKVMMKSFGGAFGLPMPGAKVRVKVSESIPQDNKYTDGMLDEIKVVPNPYYIRHEGVKSPYDSKIYFTKLPKVCTIDIYTINGQHVRKIEHNDLSNSDDRKASIEVFDLLSKYKQRVQSQTLIAIITTPDGAQTTKKFTVVVGGFRLIEE